MLLYIKSQQTRVYCFIPLFKCTVVVLLSNFGLLEAVLWSHACPSVRLSVTSFSWNWLISFSEMLHNTKNRETEKIGRLNFFKKFLVCSKISSKRVQNRDFLSFLEFFFIFVGNMLNSKIFQFFIFLFKLHIWKFYFLRFMPEVFHPVRLLDSLIINISGRKASISKN